MNRRILRMLSKSARMVKKASFDSVSLFSRREETQVRIQSAIGIEAVIDYIESHLDGKLELECVSKRIKPSNQ